MDNRKRKKKWLIIPVAAAVLLAGAGYARLRGKAVTSETESLETEKAAYGKISVTAEGSGSVEAASTRAVTLEYDGKIEEIYIETGDQVKEGDVLALYDADAMDRVIDQKEAQISEVNAQIAATDDSGSSSITAPVSGRVKRIFAASGDVAANVVDVHGGVAEISADGKLKVIFETDVQLAEGDNVTVEVDSESVSGIVTDVDNGSVTVTIDDDEDYDVDTEVEIRDKSGSRIGSGQLASNHPYLVDADYGVIDSVEISKNERVSAGATLFTRKDVTYNRTYLDLLSDREELIEDLMELKAYQKNPVVKADSDGYVVSLDVIEGMTYEKDQQLCTIADEGTLQLKTEIDELDIDGVAVGQSAQVVFDAFEDEVYEGTVTKISGVGTNVGGVTTYTVTIELDGDAHLKNAMSATANILVEEKSDILVVSVDTISSVDGVKYVTVVSGDTTMQKQIQTGITDGKYVEVTEGLSEGEEVVVSRQHSTDLFSQMMNARQDMAGSM